MGDLRRVAGEDGTGSGSVNVGMPRHEWGTPGEPHPVAACGRNGWVGPMRVRSGLRSGQRRGSNQADTKLHGACPDLTETIQMICLPEITGSEITGYVSNHAMSYVLRFRDSDTIRPDRP